MRNYKQLQRKCKQQQKNCHFRNRRNHHQIMTLLQLQYIVVQCTSSSAFLPISIYSMCLLIIQHVNDGDSLFERNALFFFHSHLFRSEVPGFSFVSVFGSHFLYLGYLLCVQLPLLCLLTPCICGICAQFTLFDSSGPSGRIFPVPVDHFQRFFLFINFLIDKERSDKMEHFVRQLSYHLLLRGFEER